MGNRARELQKKGYQVLLSFEQAIGFAHGGVVVDKVRSYQCCRGLDHGHPAVDAPPAIHLLLYIHLVLYAPTDAVSLALDALLAGLGGSFGPKDAQPVYAR